MSDFNTWLRGQSDRPDHVSNLAFEASHDPAWPREAHDRDATERYLLEERAIFGQKIYAAVDEAWVAFEEDVPTCVQHRSAAAPREYPAVKKAAEPAGVHKATSYQWLQAPDLQAAYPVAKRRLAGGDPRQEPLPGGARSPSETSSE